MSPEASPAEPRRTRRPVRVLVFSGSLRGGSLNERLVSLAASVMERQGITVIRGSLTDFDCPSYDGDAERSGDMPAGAVRLRDHLLETDAFLISSPEYNASMPGVLKNVIDWASRFRPQPFHAQQGMLMSASPSMAGGNRGLWSLRIPLEHLGARLYPDMFSLAQAHEALGADGRIINPVLQSRFERTIECFLDLVEASIHYPALKTQWVEYLGEQPNPETNRVQDASGEAA